MKLKQQKHLTERNQTTAALVLTPSADRVMVSRFLSLFPVWEQQDKQLLFVVAPLLFVVVLLLCVAV